MTTFAVVVGGRRHATTLQAAFNFTAELFVMPLREAFGVCANNDSYVLLVAFFTVATLIMTPAGIMVRSRLDQQPGESALFT